MTQESYRSREWRCPNCHTKLGVASEQAIEIRYKQVRYVARGEVTAYCRRCEKPTRLVTSTAHSTEAR